MMTNQCSNCGASFTTTYCPDCGQKSGTGRLTMHNITHELWHGFTHTDKGIIKLWIDLLLRPATAYNNYFNGKRKSYFSPVVFFLVSFGLYIYLDQQVFNYEDYVIQKTTGQMMNNEIGRYQQEHLKYIALSLLPLQALVSYLFFNKRYNFAECIAFWLFCVAFMNTILVLSTPFRLLFIRNKSDVDYLLRMLLWAVYLWHTMAVFGTNNWNRLKCFLLVLIMSVADVYATFYVLSAIFPPYYPSLWNALRIIFTNLSPTYKDGLWKLI